jgi:hypothetical protein
MGGFRQALVVIDISAGVRMGLLIPRAMPAAKGGRDLDVGGNYRGYIAKF